LHPVLATKFPTNSTFYLNINPNQMLDGALHFLVLGLDIVSNLINKSRYFTVAFSYQTNK